MKTLIIGEVSNSTLSSGTLEILGKAKELGTEFELITIGPDDAPSIGIDSITQKYVKRNAENLQFNNIATIISEYIKDNEVKLVLSSSTYVCRDIISFISVDLLSSPVSNVIDFSINNGSVETINSINGGESIYKSKVNSEHALLLIRPKAFEPIEAEFKTKKVLVVDENSFEEYEFSDVLPFNFEF